MRQDAFPDAVDAYTEALKEGLDNSDDLLSKHTDRAEELSSLFELTRGLHKALLPVEARVFKAKLRGRLMTQWARNLGTLSRGSRRIRGWGLVAIAGSVLSILGLIVLLIRKLRAAGGRQAESAPVPI